MEEHNTDPSAMSLPSRKPYAAPAVTRVPLVPEELLVAACSKTPSICHFHNTIQQTKS